jgi:hypothetical protein
MSKNLREARRKNGHRRHQKHNKGYCSKDRKMRYRDKREADQAIHFIQVNRADRRKLPTRSYYCSYCKGYHITSQERAR